MGSGLHLREMVNKLSTWETVRKWHATRGVRMCTDIQLSCQLAVRQARRALPCGAYAIWKENLFHAWFNVFFLKGIFSLLSQKLGTSVFYRKAYVWMILFKIFNTYFTIWKDLASCISSVTLNSLFLLDIFLFLMDFKRVFRKDKEKSNQGMSCIGKKVLWENVEFCLKGLIFIELRDVFTIFTYIKGVQKS